MRRDASVQRHFQTKWKSVSPLHRMSRVLRHWAQCSSQLHHSLNRSVESFNPSILEMLTHLIRPFSYQEIILWGQTLSMSSRPIQHWWNFDDRIWKMSHFRSIGSHWDQGDFVTFSDISSYIKKQFFDLWLKFWWSWMTWWMVLFGKLFSHQDWMAKFYSLMS